VIPSYTFSAPWVLIVIGRGVISKTPKS
jgi:hypothetical protein